MMWIIAVLGVVAAAAFLAREAEPFRELTKTTAIGMVPPIQQSTNFTCGPVALRAVLAHYGVALSELDAARLVGCQPVGGVQMAGVVRGALEAGLWARGLHMRDVDCLAPFIRHGIPVMVIVRSWNHANAGHWCVVTGAGGGRVVLMDPNTPGNVRRLTAEEFDERWWHVEDDQGESRVIRRPAVIVMPRREEETCQ